MTDVPNISPHFCGLTYAIVVGSPIGNWNVLGVTDMSEVFRDNTSSGCNAVDLTGWNTSNVKDMVSRQCMTKIVFWKPISCCMISMYGAFV